VLGLLGWFLLHLKLDVGKVVANLLQANLWLVGLSVVLVFPFIALKAWRWQLILHDLGLTVPFSVAYRLYAVGLSAGSFTPGQAGDAIKAWYLREHGFSLSAGLVSIVLDRLFDVAVLIMLAASGLSALGSDFFSELPALLVLLVGTVAALVALSVPALRDRLLGVALKVVLSKSRKNPEPESAISQSTANEGGNNTLPPVKQVRLLSVFGLTIVASLLALIRIWFLALALGINLNPLQVIAASSLATVVALIPFSVGGIGVRDLALIGILGKLGYSQEQAVSLSSFVLLLTLINLVVGYLIWARRPKYTR
jgi:uncharacterized protein (TIRG00374 family)